jgi:hypothetical protein
MTISATTFGKALRAKYPNAQAALKALGLDENFLSRENLMATNKAPSKFANFAMQLVANALAPILAKDAKIDLMPVFKDVTAKTFKAAPVKMALDSALRGKIAADAAVGMGHVAQMLDHIESVAGESRDESVSPEEHAAMEAAAHGESSLGIPKKVGEEFAKKDEGAGDKKFGWDEEKVEGFKQFLRDQGMSEADIAGAMDALGLPANGVEGGMGGALSGRHAEDRMKRLAHDSAMRERDRVDCEALLPEVARISHDIGDAMPELPPPSMSGDAAADFAARFPGAARIGTSPF